jgi:hypothetical protein
MKLYKARNGNRDLDGKMLYVFVIAKDDEEAETLAKEAFSHHPGVKNEETGEFIRMHAIIEDVSQPSSSAVWGLPSED